MEGMISADSYKAANLAYEMNFEQYVSYAVFAAEEAVRIYEESHPDDLRARNRLEVVKKYIANPIDEKRVFEGMEAIERNVQHAIAAAFCACAAGLKPYDPGMPACGAAYIGVATVMEIADPETKERILNYGLSLLGKEK
jgi:hypothetical protein